MSKTRVVAFGLFVVAISVTSLSGRPLATDGIKFNSGYPKKYPTGTGKYWIQAQGTTDNTKYPEAALVA